MAGREAMMSITHFSGRFRTIPGIYPYTFDANSEVIKVAPVHIAIIS